VYQPKRITGRSMYPQVRANFFCVLFLNNHDRAMFTKAMGPLGNDQSRKWVSSSSHLAAISH